MRQKTIFSILLIIFVIFIDQWIKVTVKTGMCLGDRIEIFSWFQIVFTENKGFAFGMSFFGTWILTLFRLVAVSVCAWYLVKCLRKDYPTGFIVCLSLIIAGAFGNIIDNCFYGLIFSESTPQFVMCGTKLVEPAHEVAWGTGYGSFLSGRVVDMFYFPLWTWPASWPLIGGSTFFGAVFNFADAAISCGAVAMVIFYRKMFSSTQN